MALANIAILLARAGLNVLAVDWDLEAPGLDRYFKGLGIESAQGEVGLVDLLTTARDAGEGSWPDWRPYLSRVGLDATGSVSLLTSGRQGEGYAKKVLEFDWTTFFTRRRGGEFVESLRDGWREEFDVTLIDSRTGITDSGGVCTIQMPDVLALVFTTTEQSLVGAKSAALEAQKKQSELPYDRLPLRVLPLPSRFDSRTQYAEAQQWLKTFAKELRPFYTDWLPKGLTALRVVERTKLPYIAYFSFGEQLPVLSESATDPETLSYAYSAAANLIKNGFSDVDGALGVRPRRRVKTGKPKGRTEESRPKVQGYDYDVYISFSPKRKVTEVVEAVSDRLRHALEVSLGRKSTFYIDQGWRTGTSEDVVSGPNTRGLNSSRCLLAFLTPDYFRSPRCQAELEVFRRRERSSANGIRLCYGIMLLGGAHEIQAFGGPVLDLREGFSALVGSGSDLPPDLDGDLEVLVSEQLSSSVREAPLFRPG